jgi:cysteinyl-tRNA synthetase
LISAKNAIEQLQNFFRKISNANAIKKFEISECKFLGNVFAALLDDMNTPASLGNVFKIVNEISIDSLGESQKPELHREFSTIIYCLGLNLDEENGIIEVPESVKTSGDSRGKGKQSHDFLGAERLRQELSNIGWVVKGSQNIYTIKKRDF